MSSASIQSIGPWVPSLAEHLRPHVRAFTVLPPAALPHWLPDLPVPTGWVDASFSADGSQPARVLTRQAGENPQSLIGCDVLNLFRFEGVALPAIIEERADCTLRALNPLNPPITYRVSMPAELDITAMRTRGAVDVGRRLWMQVTNFVITAAGAGALIEHTMLVDAQSRSQLTAEISALGDAVQSSLIASVSSQRVRPGIPEHILHLAGDRQVKPTWAKRLDA